jgi:hypothetical protein
LAKEVDEVLGVVFCPRNCATLKAGTGSSGTAKASGCGDEFHHFERDLFVAPQGRSRRRRSGDGCVAQRGSPGWNESTPRPFKKGDAVPMITDMTKMIKGLQGRSGNRTKHLLSFRGYCIRTLEEYEWKSI